MRIWLAVFWLCLPPAPAAAGATRLPSAVAALLPSATKVAEVYEHRKMELDALEADALPQVEKVRALKSKPSGWLRDWELRRSLAELQERLDALNVARGQLAQAHQDLFLQLSALEEELRSALERELERGGASPQVRLKIKNWLEAKKTWDSSLEELGSSESKPFELVEVPQDVPTRAIMEDRKKALEARGLQLEAWADMLASDLRLWRRLDEKKFVPKPSAQARIVELEGLSRRVANLRRENEAQRLANRPQKK